MAIVTYPLNGIDFSAEDAETYLCTRTSGVFSADGNFKASVTGDRQVTISPGLAWIKNSDFSGKSVCNTEPVPVEIPLADGTRPRIDRIVLRFDKARNESSIVLKQGTPSIAPAASNVERTELVYELGLCTVYIKASNTIINNGDVTSTLLDESVCGLMRDGVTGIPTSQLQEQAYDLINDLREVIAGVESGTEMMTKAQYDPSGGGLNVCVQEYECVKKGSVYALTGDGAVGRFKVPAAWSAGDTWTVNGKAVPAYCGADAADGDSVVAGRWVLFTYDGTQLNFKGGGGLATGKLALATATESDVLEGLTFYAGDKKLKTGAMPSMEGASVDVSVGGTYTFPTSGKYCLGNMIAQAAAINIGSILYASTNSSSKTYTNVKAGSVLFVGCYSPSYVPSVSGATHYVTHSYGYEGAEIRVYVANGGTITIGSKKYSGHILMQLDY